MTRRRYLIHAGIIFISYLVSYFFLSYWFKREVISAKYFYLTWGGSLIFILFFFYGIVFSHWAKSLFWKRVLFFVAYITSLLGIFYTAIVLITPYVSIGD